RVVLAVVAAGTGARARKVEERRTVEEEVALLRIEQREAGEVHLPLVHLGLREVGVDRQVRAERRRRVIEKIDARLARSGRFLPACWRILRASKHVGLDVEAVPLRDAGQSRHAPALVM